MSHRCYHVDIGIPEGVDYPVVGSDLRYTLHAHNAGVKDRVHTRLPVVLPDYTLVEVEADGPVATKWVVRCMLDDVRDLVLVVTMDYVVKTVWVNRRDDTHATLNRNRYDRPGVVELVIQ